MTTDTSRFLSLLIEYLWVSLSLSLYVHIIIWGFSTKYVHMYIIIWDLLHQVGTYVRTYEVRTYVHMYIISGVY